MAHQVRLTLDALQSLIDELRNREYTVIGPKIENKKVVYEEISKIDDLPAGWTDEQESARYRLHKTDSPALFDITHSMNAWIHHLYPSKATLLKASRENSGFTVERMKESPPKYALFGIRPCDLEAMKKYDRILLKDKYHDEIYKKRREKTLIISANCTRPSGTCFCASMESGPKAISGYDLALTEIIRDGDNYFIADIGSESAQELIDKIPQTEASADDIAYADSLIEKAREEMGRTLNTENLKEILQKNYENTFWDTVGDRCLTCGNCTLVCPTCFCTTIQDYTDLTGSHVERIRQWDSCYNNEFSYIHGGSVRTSSYAQYRHWLMHKLATYHDQFDTSGCVGCGRCITWCPAAIDITEEASAIRKHSITV